MWQTDHKSKPPFGVTVEVEIFKLELIDFLKISYNFCNIDFLKKDKTEIKNLNLN